MPNSKKTKDPLAVETGNLLDDVRRLLRHASQEATAEAVLGSRKKRSTVAQALSGHRAPSDDFLDKFGTHARVRFEAGELTEREHRAIERRLEACRRLNHLRDDAFRHKAAIAVALAVRLSIGLDEWDDDGEYDADEPRGAPVQNGDRFVGRDDIFDAAIRMLQQASDLGEVGEIYLSWRALDTDMLRRLNRLEWETALRRLLRKGWKVVQTFDPQPTGHPVRWNLQDELVCNLLSFMTYRGSYDVVTGVHEDLPDVVLATRLGALAITETSRADPIAEYVAATSRIDLRGYQRQIDATTSQAFRALHATVSEALATTAYERPFSIDDIEPESPLMSWAFFDRTLTRAEDESDYRRIVKSGLAFSTMPACVADVHGEMWASKREVDASIIAWVIAHRKQRHEKFLRKAETPEACRDICTREALSEYLSGDADVTVANRGDGVYGPKFLAHECRIIHVEYLISLLEDPNLHYEIALPPESEVWVPVGTTWWEVVGDREASRNEVFFVTRRGANEAVGALRDTQRTDAARAFRNLFDAIWTHIQESYDERATLTFLKDQVQEAGRMLHARRAERTRTPVLAELVASWCNEHEESVLNSRNRRSSGAVNRRANA